MNDLLPHKHGEEGTHAVCNEVLEREGGKAVCCECNGHECKVPIKLQFRARLPDGQYFYQKDQYINSFMRRALMLLQFGPEKANAMIKIGDESGHESYLEKPLEEYLEIFINGEWIKCTF